MINIKTNGRNIEITVIITLILVAIVVKNISYKSFVDYENTILSQQNSHILTIAKSTAKNVEFYVDEKVKEIENLADNLAIGQDIEEISDQRILDELKLFKDIQGQDIRGISYISPNGKRELSYPLKDKKLQMSLYEKGLAKVRSSGEPYIGKAEKDEEGHINFYIYYPIISNDTLKGTILTKVKIVTLYNNLIKPIKLEKQGHIMVKDSKGIILMHQTDKYEGYKALEESEEIYPNLKKEAVKELIEKQLSGIEGTYIDSIRWSRKNQEKEMYGFAPAIIGDDFWVISVVMPYGEINNLIKGYFYSSSVISLFVIFIFAWVLSLFTQMVRDKDAYRVENLYLRELNETTEKLRKKEVELHHKRKVEIIGTLTGGIAHEFNNILTPIMGYSEMILDTLDPETEMYEDVKVIYDSSKRSEEIIDQILLYNNKTQFKHEVISLNEIIKDVKKIAESLVPSNVEFQVKIEDKDVFIYGNKTQLHQVILNLIKNSVNAMKDSKEKKIELELKKEDSIIRLSIRDTGCGMDDKTMEKIFTPFYTKKLTKKSTGLGLYVVLEIIKKHNGTIKVDSQVDRGSRFVIELPIMNDGATDNIVLEEDREVEDYQGTEKILILDDEELIVKMLEKGLGKLGYETQTFTNSENFLKVFDSFSLEDYDVLITDLTMPGINGLEVSKYLRNVNKRLKIIVVTAHLEESFDKYVENGIIDEYLLKPISSIEISRCIRKVLEK